MTSSLEDGFYEGFWTDWTKGGVQGRTLTLGPKSAILLTNSLAMFVTLCSIQIWAIVRYILHLCGPNSELNLSSPQLAQQLILRNTGSALTTAFLTIEMIWDYRKRAWKVLRRPYSIVLWAVIYAGLFTTAGIFSNKAISASRFDGASVVLIRGGNCGTYTENYTRISNREYTDIDEFNVFSESVAMLGKEVQRSLQYAQQCYMQVEKETERSSVCGTLKNSTIGIGAPKEGLCPVDPSLCDENSEAITFDTGVIDTHEHLGINADLPDRLKYQRLTTCAVLNDTGRITGWNGSISNNSTPRPQSASAFAYYGENLNQKTAWTYAYSNFASFYDNFTALVTSPYQLNVAMAMGITDPQWSSSDFQPIPELVQADADLTLIFLSFTGMYLGEIDDPWFSAHQAQHFSNRMSFLETRYMKDQPISTAACTERHNICTANGICTGYLGFDQIQNVEVFNTELTPQQNVTFNRLLYAIVASRMFNVVETLPQTTIPLTASLLTQIGNSGAVLSSTLPTDQWRHEFAFWYAIAMAQLQRSVVLWATGQIVPAPQYLVPAKADDDIWFCDNVVVHSNIYQSFSVLAMVIIVVFGTILVAISVSMDGLADLVAHYLNRAPRGKNWKNDGMLVLQRRKTKTRRGSILSRSVGYPMNSPRHEHSVNDCTRLSVLTPNSARASSGVFPKDNTAFVLASSRDVTNQGADTRGKYHESWVAIRRDGLVPGLLPMSQVRVENNHTHEKALPPVPPRETSSTYPLPMAECSPRVTQILDWMNTVHSQPPAYARGGYDANGRDFS